MHPFVHAFTPAIDPPWETRTDFDTFHAIARALQRAGPRRTSGVRRDVVAGAAAARHPGRDRPARRRGCATGAPATSRRCPAARCRRFVVVERDYAAVADKMAALGPLVERLGLTTKAVTVVPDEEVDHARATATA